MKLKDNLKLRKMGSNYMIVDTDTEQVNMVDVYTLNETAATLWQAFEGREFTPEEMADYLCEEYDVAREQAGHDVEVMLGEWREFGLTVNGER